jgi:hypothetical protein
MSLIRLPLAGALATLLLACAPARRVERPPAQPSGLPGAAAWVRHLERDLVPFWTQPAALGDPVGSFPTFRCNDGRAWDAAAPCPELADAPEWIRGALGRDYTRMRSRQTYFYGAAFHLLGDERLLELARSGALRIAAEVDGTGSIPSWLGQDGAAPAPGERTTQDLAYAQLGLAMYWYLTRDPAVLDALVRVERHVFDAYWRDDWGMLGWTRDGPEAHRQELVAQLDQVNAYLLLLAPLLPEPHRQRWTADLDRVARVLVDRYWDEESGMFWGRLDDPAERRPGGRHFDFGHSIKALWMLERIAVATGDAPLAAWVRPRAARLLARAYVAETGCWASGPRADGALDRSLTWWTFAELDQTAATLALAEPAQARYLAATAACWHARLVDSEQGGVWAWADPDDPARHAGKAHLWKNGYHEGEHALVMAIASAALAGQSARLHFALPAATPDSELRPYFFAGRAAARRPAGPSRVLPGHALEQIEFDSLR